MDPNKINKKKPLDGLKKSPKIGSQNTHWARATKPKPNIQLGFREDGF